MSGCPVVAAFDAAVDAGPDRPAVVLAGRTVSFGELDGRAGAVAELLLGQPGGRTEPVALSINDPVLMIAAQFGTLRAGRPFVVINPHFPAARQRSMRDLVGATTVLTDDDVPTGSVTTRPACPAGPDDLAYVLFTSGSTGVPKAVAQTRADMAQNVLRHAPLGISPADRITLISADGVVSAISNLVIGLLNGAAVVPFSYRSDAADGLLGRLLTSGTTVFYAFPSFLRQLAKVTPAGVVPTVRLAYLGGEPVFATDFALLGRLFPEAVRATGLNSTETGLTRLFQLPVGQPVPARVPLGGAVDGVDVTVAGDGRIVIRSRYVKPRLWTADGLVDLSSPGPDGVPELVTGDRGELAPDGTLTHLGRGDAMVKIRGFRVEPSEVEDAVGKIDGVTEVGVVTGPGDDGDLELAAVVTVDRPEVDATAIRARAGELLPQPMVPTTVLITERLPRIANGKLDRRALTALVAAARQKQVAVGTEPAGDGTYERLVAIWRTVLRTDRIGAEDDFFTLGGTSISALGVISRVRKEFGVPVRLAVLFETPTLAALTRAVDELRS